MGKNRQSGMERVWYSTKENGDRVKETQTDRRKDSDVGMSDIF